MSCFQQTTDIVRSTQNLTGTQNIYMFVKNISIYYKWNSKPNILPIIFDGVYDLSKSSGLFTRFYRFRILSSSSEGLNIAFSNMLFIMY